MSPVLRNEKGKIAALPYIFTWSRFPLAIAFYFAISTGHRYYAWSFLALAVISDYLDGYFARKHDPSPTAYGTVLDPAMDKIFVLFALMGLLKIGIIDSRQVVFLLSRDIFTALVTVLCYPWIKKRMQIRSRLLGKAVTNLQFISILSGLLLGVAAPGYAWVIEWLAVLTLVVSLLSILDYTRTYFRGAPQMIPPRAKIPSDIPPGKST